MNWKKILLIGLMAGGFALASASRAEAGVSVGIGIGINQITLEATFGSLCLEHEAKRNKISPFSFEIALFRVAPSSSWTFCLSACA